MSEDKQHPIVYTYVEFDWELSDTPGYLPVVWLSEEEMREMYPKPNKNKSTRIGNR